MGNQKSLYKVYFNELYLKRGDQQKRSHRPQTGIDTHTPNPFQTHSSSGSSRHTPDSLMQGTSYNNQQLFGKSPLTNTGRATADIPTSSTSRYSGVYNSRPQKTIRIVIDNNYSFSVNVPEKLLQQIDEDQTNMGTGSSIAQSTTNQNSEIPTCGWLLEQVQLKYAQLVKELKPQSSSRSQFRKKLIVALKTVDKNENIDFYLTQYSRPLKPLPGNLVLEPHYTKIIQNKAKAVLSNEFELLKVIGKGGFSKVYMGKYKIANKVFCLVRKKDTGFIYAMKVMKKDQITNETKLKQIMNERNIMEQLADHPFIVKLHYTFQSKENLHFIIDFCTGGEMFYHLQQNGRFPEFLAKFYFAEILLGLEHLHSKNIVYRDLKPENVLIDMDGHIKLADFGLSKIFKTDERSFSFCGSPEYMSPEILKREGHNHMVDFYTLGAMLYEMLTGLPPYYTNNKSEMTRRILESELTFPSHLNPETVSLMKRLLDRNPGKRLGSMRGVEEIKEHEWCSDIDWNIFLQKKIVPPWKPKLDQSNFDPEYTQLPLNFDESNFKRALQGDREFSVYYESPIQSLTVTEHSIYASNPDLTNTTNAELQLQSGSSKQLLEHFFNQQTHKDRQPTILMSPNEINDIYQQQILKMQMNMDNALKLSSQNPFLVNQSLLHDESKLTLDNIPNNNTIMNFNDEQTFRGFSFFGEGQEEMEVKRQLIKYTKLRNKLNLRLKKIQDEEGVIRHSNLRDISLSTPSSSLSLDTVTILPTPPVIDDGTTISRNSNPSVYNRLNTINSIQSNATLSNNHHNQTGNEQNTSLKSGGSPQPMYHNHYGKGPLGLIDKKTKQQMIFNKLGSDTDKALFKSFQPSSNETYSKMNSITSGIGSGTNSGLKKKKNYDLFRSNVETPNSGLLMHQYNTNQLSHKDYLNESIQQSSSCEEQDESVAEERQSFTTVHQTSSNTHQNINSAIDFYRSHQLEESKDEDQPEFQFTDYKSKIQQQEESKESSPRDSLNKSTALKNVKFILFQSQNINKKKESGGITSSINKQSKTPKLIMTQRSRMGSKKDTDYYPQSQSNQYSSLSNSGNNSRIQQLNTVGVSIQNNTTNNNNNSSSSQALTSSRDNAQNTTNEQKSILEKTTDYASSTKNTFEHNSQKSGNQQVQAKRTKQEDDDHNTNPNDGTNSDDLDKTTNIMMSLQQIEKKGSGHNYSQQVKTSNALRQLKISPRKLQKGSIDFSKQHSDEQPKVKLTKKPNLEIDISSSPLISAKNSKQISSLNINDNNTEEEESESPILQILQQPINNEDNEEEEEFIITRIKKVSNTVKGNNEQGFNFQLNPTIDKDSESQIINKNQSINQSQNSLPEPNLPTGFQFGLKGLASTIGERIKKIGGHSKKISADNTSTNDLFNQIKEKVMTREIDLFEVKKNSMTQSNNTPTHSDKKNFIMPSPQEKRFKKLIYLNEDGSSQVPDTISEVTHQTNTSQSSKKEQQLSKFSSKKLIGFQNIKHSQTLKKNTVGTASTIGFNRPLQVDSSSQLQQQSSNINKQKPSLMNKPPLNTNLRNSDVNGQGINKKQTKYIGGGKYQASNSGSGTPQGNSKPNLGGQKSKFQGNFASSSQPSSAKNSSSNKFTFPSPGNSLDQSQASPLKKLVSQRSNLSGVSKSSKGPSATISSQKQHTASGSFHQQQQKNEDSVSQVSDSLRLPKNITNSDTHIKESSIPSSGSNIQALKPPKTMKNANSNIKGFFQ